MEVSLPIAGMAAARAAAKAKVRVFMGRFYWRERTIEVHETGETGLSLHILGPDRGREVSGDLCRNLLS